MSSCIATTSSASFKIKRPESAPESCKTSPARRRSLVSAPCPGVPVMRLCARTTITVAEHSTSS
ncbi:hypothetical protein BDU57DRAFT_520741 [Ampelomyces quisqualis]|uniref:Uncharacterized protein n=1 Tax=Ampelomyces quisqualis TaxID=50730 RepID=A0A6A5QGX4_AMPQU|nr:hypothetical protein BDU57DRAFT_520741 [Ampelomyces quisqualis]